MAETNPAFLPDLATSLNNLAAFLSGLGRRAEALASAEEAVTLRRAFVETNPAFLPNLAASLRSLAEIVEATGDPDRAAAVRAEIEDLGVDGFTS